MEFAFAGESTRGLTVLDALARKGMLPKFILRNPNADLSSLEQTCLQFWATASGVELIDSPAQDRLATVDLLLVADFQLPKEAFQTPRLGAINVQAREMAVIVHMIDEEICAGPVLLQRELPSAPYYSPERIRFDIAHMGARLCAEIMEQIASTGALPKARPQPRNKLKRVDFSQPASQLKEQIDDLGVFCFEGAQPIKIKRGIPTATRRTSEAPGTVLAHLGSNRFVVRCGMDEALLVTADRQPAVGARLM